MLLGLMDELRPADPTRRAALTLVAAAVPALSQSRPPAQPVVHFEIGCRDRAKTAQYFGELFGWQIHENGPASMIDAASQRGIPGHITSLGHEPQHYTIFYVQVDDVQAYLDKAVALGGKTVVPPIKTPAFTFAWFSDPEGNTIGLLKPA